MNLQVRVDQLERDDTPFYEASRDVIVAGPVTPEEVEQPHNGRILVPMFDLTPDILRTIADTMELAIHEGRTMGILVTKPKDSHGAKVGYISA